MTDTTTIDFLIGAGMPVIVALINQCHWNAKVKGIVALIVCGLVAALTEYLRGDLNWHDWRNTALVVVAAALVSYHTFWKPTTIAPAIESATTASNPAT